MNTRYLPAVKKYIKLMDDLPVIIKLSGVKEKALADALGLSKKTFYNRKTLKNWTPEEVYSILQIIENEQLIK